MYSPLGVWDLIEGPPSAPLDSVVLAPAAIRERVISVCIENKPFQNRIPTDGARRAHRAGDAPGGARVPGASGLPDTGGGAGDWSVDGHRAGGDRRSAPGVSQRPASGSLVGAGASALFQWRQGAVRRDLKTRESVCADAADSWGARRRAAGRAADRYAGTVAVRAHTPQRYQCGRGRLSQQKCPSDLGLVGP
jgi:hypothetical protein